MAGGHVGNAYETAVGLFWLILAYSGLFDGPLTNDMCLNELGSEAMTSCDIEL